ncbi:MAG: helix-turn-helix transcriptional regulator [Actinomycetota bacterium]|nr:helix-turn-helix transcriptional regulator [Actinomycetota bacterium]
MRVRSIRDVASAVRGRRKDLGLSQAELAEVVGVSRKWIYEFEGGKPRAEFVLVLRVLEYLGLTITIDDDGDETFTPSFSLDALLEDHRYHE